MTADPLWGPIDQESWKGVPHISGRKATETDVQLGRAVFYIEGPSEPYDIQLPVLGWQRMEDGLLSQVIVIQAEAVPQQCILGVRYFSGGNGVCHLSEVVLAGQSDA